MIAFRSSWKRLTLLSILAGILYNSWPLGLIFNPVVARRGQASELAGVHQPYSWLFTYGDVACSVLMVVVGWRLWVHARRSSVPRTVLLPLGSLLLFSVSASVAALCPVQCIAALQQCPTFTHNFFTLLHGITSVLAAVGLFGGVFGLWLQRQRSAPLIVLILSYVALGSWTLLVQFTPGKDAFVQNIFITICALCLASYPFAFAHVYKPVAEKASE